MTFGCSGGQRWERSFFLTLGAEGALDAQRRTGNDDGGAQQAQALVRLDLVDLYHLVVFPVVSEGASWFAGIEQQRAVKLVGATTYSNGVVGSYYTRAF